jgi:hypothetical protein
MRSGEQSKSLQPLWLLPLAALLAIHPLILHGISCGQDLSFHIQSWLDAATQLRQGHYPHWAFSPAWNAGEPRFLFYPPLSWLIGALLVSVLPAPAAPIAFIFLALTAAGFAMYRLTREYVSPNAALIASAFYLASPYILFCAFERTAFAELLAAAWMPLLFLGTLSERPTMRGIAIPIALLWLTNAPAAVMGCYAFALLALIRVLRAEEKIRLATTYVAATVLGLALPAFYLIPAAYERRYVQVAMAVIPNMRVQDNFLFTHTADAAHNIVNHTASTLALGLLLFTAAILITLILRKEHRAITTILTILTAAIAFLLTPLSLALWMHLPNLQFLQFPWRLISILSTILAFALALLLDCITLRATPFIAIVTTLALTVLGYHLYAQQCDNPSLPASIANLYRTHHGAPPTDEYTAIAADNDTLRTGNPGYWLADTPNAAAPNTVPTAVELNPNIDTDDTPVPDAQTLSTAAPQHFVVHTNHPAYLVLNLRNYPSWDISTIDPLTTHLIHPTHIQRNDGLIAINLPAATDFTIDITWHRTLDQTLGRMLSVLAALTLLVSSLRSSRRNTLT